MRQRLKTLASSLAAIGSAAGVAGAQSLYLDADAEPRVAEGSEAAAQGETVADAVRDALLHDPQIDVASAQQDAAGAERFRALGGFLPNIEATASYTDDALRSSTLSTLEDRDGTTLGVTASQPVFQGLSTLNRFREARARFSQAQHALTDARQRTALAAAQSHAGVVLAREIVQHRIDNLALVNKQLEAAERRRRAGAQSRTGVEQARMRSAQAQVDLGQARAFLAEREAAYERIVGRAPPPALEADPATDNYGLDTLQTALMEALASNPGLNAARAGAKAADHARSAAKGDFAPRLSVEGTYFRRYGDAIAEADDEEYQVVARVRLPIFAQGRNVAGLRSSAAAAAEEKARVVGTRLFVEETVTRSWRQLAEAEARRLAATGAIGAAELSVRGLQIEYEAGQRTLIDVLDGQRDLVVANISRSQAEHDYRAILYELAATAGRLAPVGTARR